jgi:hypothetical protein
MQYYLILVVDFQVGEPRIFVLGCINTGLYVAECGGGYSFYEDRRREERRREDRRCIALHWMILRDNYQR